MPNQETKPIETFDSFEELFQRAEERTGYWVELAKLEFTEEMLARMKERGITKSQLAVRLEGKPAFVTRLVSGHNNFTLETMVRIARALDCEFRSHLQPKGAVSQWLDFLTHEPVPQGPPPATTWGSEDFTNIVQLPNTTQNEPVRATA